MKDNFFPGLIIGAVLGLLVGAYIGVNAGVNSGKKEAIEHNAAQYEVDTKTGEVKFVWINTTNIVSPK